MGQLIVDQPPGVNSRENVGFSSMKALGSARVKSATLGYDSHPEKKGYLVVNESEAHQVRRIFQVFAEQGSVKSALDQICLEGIQTKRRVYQDGRIEGSKDFTFTSIWGMLRNRHYIAEREIHKRFRYYDKEKVPEGKEYQTTQASWPAIVPKDLFDSVQSRLDWNAKKYRPNGRRNFDYIYSSTVFCGECGQPMVGRSGKGRDQEKRFYYAHKAKKKETRQSPGCPCHWYSFDALDLHKILRNRIKKLAEDPVFVERLYQDAEVNQAALIPDNQRRIEVLDDEIKALHQQIASLMSTLQGNPTPIVRDLVTQEIDTQGSTLKTKTLEQKSLRSRSDGAQATPVESREFSELAQTWDKTFSKLSPAERKDFVRLVIGRIEFFPERLRIRYN